MFHCPHLLEHHTHPLSCVPLILLIPRNSLSTLVASRNEGSCQNAHSNKEEGNVSQEARLQYNSGKDEQPGPMGKTEVETEREELF